MEEEFLEIKVNIGCPEIALFDYPSKIDFNYLSESLSYCPVTIELVETNERETKQKVLASLFGYFFDIEYLYNYNQSIFDAFDIYV